MTQHTPYHTFSIQSAAAGRRPTAMDLVESVLRSRREGRLPAGARLPPVRAIERQLGVSKNTVQCAYDELVARGVCVAREREGVFVAHDAAEREAVVSRSAAAPRVVATPALSGPAASDAIKLSSVFIDPALLPRERLADCARSVLRTPGLDAFYDPQGYAPLRAQIAERLSARAMAVEPSQVIITTGSQQALDIVVRALATRRVAVEDPVYSHARFLFENLGATLSPLRLDPFEGIDLDGWRAVIERDAPSLLYSITRFQNPTGYSYQPHELDALLALSERTGMGLLEDDWGSDMLSDGDYRPTLRALGGDNVLYANSFTKKLLPSLRVGYLVAPRALVPTLVAMKRLSTLGNPWLTEAVLSEFLDRGYYDTHLRAVQAALDARYARCLDALSARMPEGCRWTLPGGGPTLWLEVPRSVDVQRISAQMAARGANIESAAAHFAGARHLNGFRVSYAFVGEADLDRALTILGDELREAMR